MRRQPPATPARQAGAIQLPLQFGMFCCLALLAIPWPALAQVGNTSLQPLHVGALLAIAALITTPHLPVTVLRFSPWLIPYLFYLLLLTLAVAGSGRVPMLNRQIFAVAGFIAVASFIWSNRSPALTLRWGSLAGLVLFGIIVEYCAQRIGKSSIVAIGDFISSGNYNVLIYRFFRPIFNVFEPSSNIVFKAALTNAIGGSLVVLALCYRVSYQGEGKDWTGILLTILVLICSILLGARSAVVAALGCVVGALIVRTARQRGISFGDMLFWAFAALALAVFAYVAELHGRSALETVTTAFSFTDQAALGRVDQYQWAFGLIEARPITGHGYMSTPSGRAIHNLFLSSWAYGGLASFLLVVLFYVGVLVAWLRWVFRIIAHPQYWKLSLPAEWVAVLPILPLFRAWLSGDGGHLPFNEWLALAVFFGLIARNDPGLLLYRLPRRSPANGDSPWVGNSVRGA